MHGKYHDLAAGGMDPMGVGLKTEDPKFTMSPGVREPRKRTLVITES